VRRLAHDRLEAGSRPRIGIGCAPALRDAQCLKCAKEIGVLLTRHHADEATEAKPRLERVGGGKRRAKQDQEAVEEAVVLDEIARHHCIGHASGKQLLDEAMPHGIRPTRLARGAQDFGEAFRHDVGSHLRFDRQDNGSTRLKGSRVRENYARQIVTAEYNPTSSCDR